ncbi:MAG TPA: response regulator, partial [Candidatus Wallbacteria bacterium]|nr:response regulator [Candidatus Wallbacteria bacterium]
MKYNILIIEDEKNQAELISKILTRKGFDTFVAASEKAALESLSVNRI